MEISKSRMFWSLYKKDLQINKNENLIILGIILAANIFLTYKVQRSWAPEAGLALSILVAGFIPLSIFFKAFTIVGNEWKENTVYMMMSLPVSGTLIFLSKVVALLTQLILFLAAALPFTWTLYSIYAKASGMAMMNIVIMGDRMEDIGILVLICVLLISGYMLWLLIAIFSSLVGRMFQKFSGIIAAGVFIGINFIANQGIRYFGNLIGFGENANPYSGISQLISHTEISLMIAFILFLITGLFMGAVTLYNKKIEL